ncbi:insecticidal delta-endotoxin Cry8Ea1 family protein [Bacillus thuringiensis]|uniref:insecticidal delta-endotoxin Cry8Ea1 family protein n=1 Tax=Bacillus thuringiensis TaxID=1428 RepID=UPI002D7F8C7F|nr:insecticidal delta-endotoxin Cry8Ea1 family protein [Bacillus thuringiensis]MEB4814629.1 insecticidal delta-endotoxin Cry8Ea1 family protein [Bacillus thuringiensis]
MNSYQNRNEYEILDASPNHENISNRYPFAKNPNAMENVNYKNWLNVREDVAPSFFGGALGIIVNLFKQYVSFIKAPSVSGGVGFLRTIIGLMTNRNVINLTIDDVQRLINQSLDNITRDAANTKFTSIQNNYNQYLLNRQNYRNRSLPRNIFVQSLQNIERELRSALDSTFSLQNRELLLLPNFTQIAMLHLTVLRDAVIFQGNDLIVPTISEGPINPLLTRPPSNTFEEALLTSIRIYSNYCVRQYEVGLNLLRNRGNTSRNWLDFNAYRLEMTFKVLDFVTLFSLFDTVKYPVSIVSETDSDSTSPVVYQLSRVIYTDPVGAIRSDGRGWFDPPVGTDRVTFTSIENEIPAPTTSRHLSELTISSGPLGFGVNPARTHSWQGNRNVNISAPTDVSGVISNRTRTIPARNIFRVNSRVYTLDWRLYGVYRAEFFQGAHSQVFSENPPTGIGAQSANNFRFLPGENSETPTPQDYTHVLSRVVNATVGLTPATGNQRNSVLIFGWTHKSLTSENIYRINEITKVAAVNTRGNSGIRVISGPGFTGGDLVRLDPNGSVSYNFTPANQQAFQSNIRIRLRYACQGTASLRITFGNASSQVISLISTTSSINNLQYENFHVVNVPNNINFQSVGTQITIQNISQNPNISLDSIELFSNIPIPQEPPFNPVVPEPPIISGNYQIVTSLDRRSIIDLNPNNNVTLWTNNRSSNQIWNFSYDQQRGAYLIRSLRTGSLVLSMDSPRTSNVFGYPSNSDASQFWILERNQDGFIFRSLRDRNLVLDVSGGGEAPGTRIIVFPFTNSLNQRFTLQRV